MHQPSPLARLLRRASLPALLLLAIAAGVMATALPGCNASGCVNNRSSIPLAGFYSYTTLKPISVDSLAIGAVGAPGDSLLVDTTAASTVYLPFPPEADRVKFYIRYCAKAIDNPRIYDTLTFVYERLPYFASEECGVMYRYDVKEFTCTRHLIDSVALPRPLIDNVDVQSVQLFFRTAEPAQAANLASPL